MKKHGLGQGLSALFGEGNLPVNDSEQITNVAITKLEAGPYQPRTEFKEEELQELADSIVENGILQPIIVKKAHGNENYKIIAGERRFRAAQLANLAEVPVIIKDITDSQALEIAIVENIQRQNLTPIEEASAFTRLIEEYSYTQEELATHLGKSRSHITNLLRLLTLPEKVQDMVNNGSLSMGHARALVKLENALHVAEEIIEKKLSVRDTERLINKDTQDRKKALLVQFEAGKRKHLQSLEQKLAEKLNTQVKIKNKAQAGRIEISFATIKEMDALIDLLLA
jgi:ParB family chromosome partitioning protein